MMLEDMLQLVIPVVTLSLTVLVLSYYLRRSRELNGRIKDASEIVESIVTEIRNRMKVQEKKVMDQEVKIEILELKMDRLSQSSLKEVLPRVRGTDKVEKRGLQKSSKLDNREDMGRTGSLTETEGKLLEYLSQRGYTAGELQSMVRKTREHTSRMLKKLFKDGFIERNESKRPFVYFLAGKDKSTSV